MHHTSRIAVLMGGPSDEHDVSLSSGRNVFETLVRHGHAADTITIARNGVWPVSLHDLATRYDVAFVALHGAYGEDGGVQADLASVQMPYTGSNALTSALAMNKYLTIERLCANAIPVPHTFLVEKNEWIEQRDVILSRIQYYARYPLVVKPNNSGSSIGVSIIKNAQELAAGFEKVFAVSRAAIVQPLVQGIEVTCGILDSGVDGTEEALPPTEIIPTKKLFFDYQEKYMPDGAQEITPARIPYHTTRAVQHTARRVHQLIGARGMSRTDMIIDASGTPFVLEVNTTPGLTPASLLPKAAAAKNIPFITLVRRLIDAAHTHHRSQPTVMV